jgi:16S rRNA (adenine1518-N6/adenine1519-N6)-dimethyltransferase
MNLASRVVVKDLLRKYNIQPFKGFGQNFLISENILKKIVEAANVNPEDIILEIGPGIGTLTQELAKKAKKVIAVEKDKKMVEILKETLVDFKNVEVLEGDALKLNPKNYKPRTNNYKLIANLPYNITSPVIRKFLEAKNPPIEMVLMVQKEVAQRICVKPPAKGEVRPKGRPSMNLLAVSVQFYSEPKILFYVSKNNFWPRPKVDGAILRISRIRTNLPRIDTNLFFKIVKAGFSQPRKQILNNLSKVLKLEKEKTKYWLERNNIAYNQRAETLGMEDWIKLTQDYIINQ